MTYLAELIKKDHNFNSRGENLEMHNIYPAKYQDAYGYHLAQIEIDTKNIFRSWVIAIGYDPEIKDLILVCSCKEGVMCHLLEKHLNPQTLGLPAKLPKENYTEVKYLDKGSAITRKFRKENGIFKEIYRIHEIPLKEPLWIDSEDHDLVLAQSLWLKASTQQEIFSTQTPKRVLKQLGS